MPTSPELECGPHGRRPRQGPGTRKATKAQPAPKVRLVQLYRASEHTVSELEELFGLTPPHHLPRGRAGRRTHRRPYFLQGAAVTEPGPALAAGYGELLDQLKPTIAGARWQVQRVVHQHSKPTTPHCQRL